jgi:hypothetical protein
VPTKSDEIRVRRILERRDLRLERCRRRDPSAEGFGLYRIATAAGVPLTGPAYTLTLEEAEAWCERARRRRPAKLDSSRPETPNTTLLVGDALRMLRRLSDRQFQCCVTSPPYWMKRDYGIPGQIGHEATPELWTARLVEVFREVRRTLRDVAAHPRCCWVALEGSDGRLT